MSDLMSSSPRSPAGTSPTNCGEGRPGIVLVVEDDAEIRWLVTDQLTNRGLATTAVATVAVALEAVRQQTFDIVILDVMLPDGSGLEVLRELRRTGSSAHVIVLSGATTELDRVRALELGADDYVVKPFFARELVARVFAVRRRRDPDKGTRLRVGRVEIDIAARIVTVAGARIELTAKEFDLLAFLVARPGHVFSRDDLLRAVWHSAPEWQQAATVTEHVRRLRSKLQVDPRQPQLLQTVRGSGYRFDTPADDPAADTSRPSLQPSRGTLVHVGGRIVAMDHGGASLVGWSEEETLGRHIEQLVTGGSLEAVRARLRLVAAGGEPRSQLFSFQHIDGREVPVEVNGRAIVWNGQPAREVDLTPVIDASDQLRHLVTGVVTEVSDAVIVTDPHFHIRSWNRAAERLYGWAESDVLGRHVVDILPWAGDESELIAAGRTLEATGRWHGVAVQLTREGAPLRVLGTTTLVRDDAGEPIGVVSVNRPAIPAIEAGSAVMVVPDAAVGEMRRGLDDGQFKVYYQPVVAVEDRRVVALEALVRWNHPDRGLVGPCEFIGTAERNGLIGELTALVLDTACREGAGWLRAGLVVDVLVNLSPKELADPGLVDKVLATLGATGMSPDHLWLEVTETALVEDVEEASVALHRLAALGVRISIDNFGTGWACLTYLKRFPVHALKIDRSFVEGIDHNVNDAAIARSIVQLGIELGLAVVAEGVETEAQQQALKDLGCALGQGFLYGSPTPVAEVPFHRVPRAGQPEWMSPAPARAGSNVAATTLLPARPGSPARTGGPSMASETVATALRALLRIRSPKAAADLLQLTAQQLGATVMPAAAAGPEALPIDLSLGEGPPVLAVVELLSPVRMELEHVLPQLAEDARQAVDLLRQTERLDEESNHDKLTGLANRRVLERVLARAEGGTVVMIDLDHFKRVNDTLGHAAGDAVLARFGRTLTAEVRASDTTCRVGGEEFVVIALGLDEAGACELVARVRAAWIEDAPHPVTFSAGLAHISAAGGTSALLAADRALYRAKRCGRNRTEIEARTASPQISAPTATIAPMPGLLAG